jgi:ornithine carbamoyltransferase
MQTNLLTLFDLEKAALEKILNDAAAFKFGNKYARILENKNIGLIFEKPSTRTRVSSEVAIRDLGGNPVYLSSADLQLSRGESIDDTASVLSRYLDGVIIRTKSHKLLETFSKTASIPVINALSDIAHPLQIIADLMTIRENNLDLDNVKVCFLGDGQNNVCRSLMAGISFYHGELTIASPEELVPENGFLKSIQEKNQRIRFNHNINEAVKGADVLYTDVWVSMGFESEEKERKKMLGNYQLNLDVIEKTGKKPVILHCLPANRGEEITDDAFKYKYSRIYDQAENRLHSMKAVLKYIFTE